MLLCGWLLILSACWGRLLQFWFDLQLKGGRGINLSVNLMLGLMMLSGLGFLWGMIGGLNIQAAIIILIALNLALIPLRGFLETAGLVIRDMENKEAEHILYPTFNLLLLIMLFLNLYGVMSPVQSSEALNFSLAVPQNYINSGRLIELPNNLRSYYGHNWEMIYLWGLLLEGAPLCRLLDIALLFITGILLFRWCTNRFGAEAGIIAGALWFFSSFLHQVPGVFSHYNAAASFSILCFIFWEQWRSGWGNHFMAAAGILAGFAVGIDHYALYFPIIPLLIITISTGNLSLSTLKYRIKAAAGFLAIAILAYMPWLLKNLILHSYQSGTFSINSLFPSKPVINPFIPSNVFDMAGLADMIMKKLSEIDVSVFPIFLLFIWAIAVWIRYRTAVSKQIWLLCLLSIPAWLILPVYNSGLAIAMILPFTWILIAYMLGRVINSTDTIYKRSLPIIVIVLLIFFFDWMINIDLLAENSLAGKYDREDASYTMIFNYMDKNGKVDGSLMAIGIPGMYDCPMEYVNSDGFMPEPIWLYLADSPTAETLKDDLVNDGFTYILSAYLPGQIPADNESRLKFLRFVDRHCELETQLNQFRLYKIKGT